VASLGIPVVTAWVRPEWISSQDAFLVWLPALVPPFLLAYYKGWHGASLALAGAMATLALVHVEVLLLGLPGAPWPYVFVLIVVLVLVSIGSGAVAELLHRERDRAEQSALTDPLTGLPNRRHASVFLDAAWAAAIRGRSMALVIFDLDRFKGVNDVQGHAEGDRVLRALGRVLAERTRRMDLSVRYGGEEFMTILMDCKIDQAELFAEQVRARVAALEFSWGRITLSAGVSAIEQGMGSPDILVAAADRALYAAKERGRDRVVRADAALMPAAGTPPSQPPPRLEAREDLVGVRVLLVDDDEDALKATGRILEHFGCVVRTADTSRDALAILTQEIPVDVVATDIVMPDMSGFTLIDVASKVRPGLPVLYMSGYPQEEVYWGGIPGARSAFLSKPLEIEGLKQTLMNLLTPVEEGGFVPETPAERAEARPRLLANAPVIGLAEPPQPRGLDKRDGRILVVDDDEAVVETLQRLFTRAGYECPTGVTDPTRVVDVLRSEPFDLMILDLYMPSMDGFEVLMAISEVFGAEEYFPVLILTGDDDPLIRRRALAAGAMDFLNKPFDPAEAEARARNLLAARFLNQRVALQRDTLEDRVAERTAELADTRSEILHRLARAAEYRDDVTGRHAERVGLLSSRVGAELGMPPREVDIIRRTAPLHDVGKIGVPDAILHKVGRLTPTEFEIMKTHTTIGAQILGGSSHRLLEVARGIALCHHERWDGLGYPHGRSGRDIPLEARIVSVADTFDTITHHRPYKPALAPADAVAEIIRCRGKHYDPDVVDAFAKISERVGLENIHGLADPLDPLRDTMGPTALSS
jgi:putative two-component system response regulator